MKIILSIVLLSGIISLFGCGSSNIGSQYKFIKPNASVKSGIGYLKIYTFKSEEKSGYADDPVYEVYNGYTIYTRNGDYVRDVEKSYRAPELVKLKEGEYIIVAELYKNIIQSFRVEIEKGKILEIDKSMIENPIASK